MAVDIKKLLEIVQKRINTLDSSTVTLQELIDIANFTDKASKGTLQFVDDSSDLPNLLNPSLPTAQSNQSLTFVKNSGRLLVKKNAWKPFSYRGLIPSPSVPNFVYGRDNYGYVALGATTVPQPPSTSNFHTNAQRHNFSSDAVSTWATSFTAASYGFHPISGHFSDTHGYTAGGYNYPVAIPPGNRNFIEKFPFSTPGSSASNVGNLVETTYASASHSSASTGFIAGKFGNNMIQSFPFASDTNASDTGYDMASPTYSTASAESPTWGYTLGGYQPSISPLRNTISKFSMASGSGATDVADLTTYGSGRTGHSSPDYGFATGGYVGATAYQRVDSFPFASEGNATSLGDAIPTSFVKGAGSASSTTEGFLYGGNSWTGPSPPPTTSNAINAFSFTSGTPVTLSSSGSLSSVRVSMSSYIQS